MLTAYFERFALENSLAAVAQVRRAVMRLCRAAGLSADTAETATLLASETASNAVLHGGPPIHAAIAVSTDLVRVEISDCGDRYPTRHDHGLESVHGRGIAIIEALANAWGVTRHGHGKTVWFELSPVASGGKA